MNQYIKFIRHVLWACFFVTFLGLLVQYIVGWESVRARLVMGHVDYDGLFSTVRST